MNYVYSTSGNFEDRRHAPVQVTPAEVADKIVFRNGYFDGTPSIVEAVLGHVPSLRNSSTEYTAEFIKAVHFSLQAQHH